MSTLALNLREPMTLSIQPLVVLLHIALNTTAAQELLK